MIHKSIPSSLSIPIPDCFQLLNLNFQGTNSNLFVLQGFITG